MLYNNQSMNVIDYIKKWVIQEESNIENTNTNTQIDANSQTNQNTQIQSNTTENAITQTN